MPDLPPRSKPLDTFTPGTRPTAHQRGYGYQWQRIRAAKLQESPLCEMQYPGVCRHTGDHVHHRDHDARNNSPYNLQTVCVYCHRHHHRNGGR